MTVEELLKCPKTIDRKRKPPFKEEFRHYKMSIELTCADTTAKMTMF